MQKTQILLVHGGMTFKNKEDYIHWLETRKISIEKKESWAKEYLDQSLGEHFEIIRPRMPLQDNAKYEEWKIHFEKHIPYLEDGLILIGSSLGGLFLAKYLSENIVPKKILSTYLVCPPFDNSMPEEDLAGGFELKEDLSLLRTNAGKLKLLFSEDDDVVPLSHAKKYKEKIGEDFVITYPGKNGHFMVSEFPEIVAMIKEDTKRIN